MNFNFAYYQRFARTPERGLFRRLSHGQSLGRAEHADAGAQTQCRGHLV